MYSKFRAKTLEGKWTHGNLVQILGDFYIIPEDSFIVKDGYYPEDKEKNLELLDKKTIGIYIEYNDSDGKEIYSGDIVQFDNFATEFIWFNNEGQFLDAIELKRDNVIFNGYDYYSDQPHRADAYKDITFMLQDPWGDFQNRIRVLGNVFDNPELVSDVPMLSR